MGRSSPPPPPPVVVQQPPPTPPAPGETTREALEAELEFRPRFREEDILDIFRFGQAQADLTRDVGFDLARDIQSLARELEPGTFEASDKATQQIIDRLDDPLSDAAEENFTRRFRAQEAAAGRLGSPVGSATVARNLADLEESQRSQALSAALSFLGRVPPPGPANVPTGSSAQFGQFVAPSLQSTASIFNTQGNIFGNQLRAQNDIFNTQASLFNAAQQNRGAGLAGLGQGFGTIVGAKIAFGCIPEGTLIDTKDGAVPVETIHTGDVVLSGNGDEVVVTMIYEFQKVSYAYPVLVMDDGSEIKASDHHMIDDKVIGDVETGTKLSEKRVVDKVSEIMFVRQYDLLTSASDGSYSVSGVRVNSMIAEMTQTFADSVKEVSSGQSS